MAKKSVRKKIVDAKSPIVMRNQFFGMFVLAVGLGALIVVVRYFIISLQVPLDVYLLEPGDLIPGEMVK